MELERTFPYLEDTFQEENFDPNTFVMAIWPGNAIFGNMGDAVAYMETRPQYLQVAGGTFSKT